MRHRARAGLSGRNPSHRLAMYRNMVTSLLDHERIETTDVKAKEVRRIAERMITLGKRGDLHARRRALRVIRSRKVAAKVFDDLAERFRDREGGYTRVIKSRYRIGDAAAMSVVELVQGPVAPEPATKDKKTAKAKAEKAEASAKKAKKKAAAEDEAKKQAAKKQAGKKKASKKKTAKKAEAKPASKKKAAKKTAAKKTTGKKK